jgi:imidazolonepropionase-like amidohydrolase
VLIDGTGAPPVEHSVIIIDGATIRAVGTQAHTPIPKGGKNIDLTGKYVTPSGSGTLEPGKPASLKVYRSNPLQAPEAPGEAESEMVDGQWIVRK